MLLTNFTFAIGTKKPDYLQLVDFIKSQIHQGALPAGSRMTSIRKLADALLVSRTTVETAYNILAADGYLLSKPQRGFYVAALPNAPVHSPVIATAPAPVTGKLPRYDFANNYVDAATFPVTSWRRHINYALRNPAALSTYGAYQGETVLRQALADYSRDSRSVAASPEQIVVGAGIQNLLGILAALLGSALTTPHRLYLEVPGFPQAEEIFTRQDWQVEHFSLAKIRQVPGPVLYLAPGNPYRGQSLTARQRQELLHWSEQPDRYLLEDDYNGEFRYYSRPVSSLQGLSDGHHIIYLGSFSRLLLPSLRLSYLVLPPALLPLYARLGPLYNQTASTLEQLALASFIQEGSLRRHLRKLRHLYNQKNSWLRDCLAQELGSRVQILANESALHLRLTVSGGVTSLVRSQQSLQAGVRVLPVPGTNEILLSLAGIAEQDIAPAVKLLARAWL
jgi:GntR family transcriptional regulator/MocR family aminotransferase